MTGKEQQALIACIIVVVETVGMECVKSALPGTFQSDNIVGEWQMNLVFPHETNAKRLFADC